MFETQSPQSQLNSDIYDGETYFFGKRLQYIFTKPCGVNSRGCIRRTNIRRDKSDLSMSADSILWSGRVVRTDDIAQTVRISISSLFRCCGDPVETRRPRLSPNQPQTNI